MNNELNNITHSNENPSDISWVQDLSFAIMNLLAIEEHLFCTGAKTNKHEYYDMINNIRLLRTEEMKKIIKEYEGEIWCTSKHLLNASMRLMEVGTKFLKYENKTLAYYYFDKSYEMYLMFISLNIKSITNNSLKENAANIKTQSKNQNNENQDPISKENFLNKMKSLISEKLDCCRE